MSRLFTVLALACAAVAGSSGGPAAAQQPTVSVETDLVMLPVTVFGRGGAVVRGLPPERFAVSDNGRAQPVEYFGADDAPATVGIVVDCSASMRALRPSVTAAAMAFAASADAADELFTMNFNEAVWPGLPQGVAFAEDTAQLHRALLRAPAVGMTALYDALDRSLDHLQAGTRERKALVLVSDGGDNASARTLPEVLDRASRSGAVVYSVLLADPNGHDARPGVLERLARATGGAVFRPSRPDDVTAAFERIGQELRGGYLLGFSPSGQGDGTFHTVRVTARGDDGRPLTVRTRAGYHAGLPHEQPR